MNYFYLLSALLAHSIYAVPSLPQPTTYNKFPVGQDWTQRPTEISYLNRLKQDLSPRLLIDRSVDDFANWLNDLVTPSYKGPCHVDKTQNPRWCDGESCFRQRIGLFNLPYGVFGVISNILHFYTFACLGFGRSPWRPWKPLQACKRDVVISITTVVVTMVAIVISFWNPRWSSLDRICQVHGRYWWTYLLILTKAYLGMASGCWSYEMNKISHKRNVNSPNQNENGERNEDSQSIVNHGIEVEFATGLAKAGWLSGRSGWKAVGTLFVLTQVSGIVGLGTVMWDRRMTILSIICGALVVLVIGYSQYISKQANEKKLTKCETFLRKMSWNITLVIVFSWADLILGLAAQNIFGRPEESTYVFALYMVGKELPFLST